MFLAKILYEAVNTNLQMKHKIVIAGGTGFIGKYLSQQFREDGADVQIIARSGTVKWTDKDAIHRALDGSDLLINLAGKSVDCRYTERNKKEILDSRVDTTIMLGEALKKCIHPPKLWINSSTATIYRHAEDHGMTEAAGEIGEGFSVNVARSWEEAFFNYNKLPTRLIALRMAIVLGKNGGVLLPLKKLVKYGLGGNQGNGKQMFSWLHAEDLYRIILFLKDHKELTGVFNASAPVPIANEVLMRSFRRQLLKSVALPAPSWLLNIGAVIIRTETELVLKSRWVLPERLLKEGFKFRFNAIGNALQDLL